MFKNCVLGVIKLSMCVYVAILSTHSGQRYDDSDVPVVVQAFEPGMQALTQPPSNAGNGLVTHSYMVCTSFATFIL